MSSPSRQQQQQQQPHPSPISTRTRAGIVRRQQILSYIPEELQIHVGQQQLQQHLQQQQQGMNQVDVAPQASTASTVSTTSTRPTPIAVYPRMLVRLRTVGDDEEDLLEQMDTLINNFFLRSGRQYSHSTVFRWTRVEDPDIGYSVAVIIQQL
jgi:hypothetical protein